MNIWQRCTTLPSALLTDVTHLYLVNLDKICVQYQELAASERQRAAKMHLVHHQHRSAAARYVLRKLLGHYLKCEGSSVTLQQASSGKLFVPSTSLKFNLSHADEWALYVFTDNIEVGIDIEQQRPMQDLTAIAKRIMHAQEYRYWQQLDAVEQKQLFFEIWTRKEALIKCTGEGLQAKLTNFCTLDGSGKIANPVKYNAKLSLQLQDLPVAQCITDRRFFAALASANYFQADYYLLEQ